MALYSSETPLNPPQLSDLLFPTHCFTCVYLYTVFFWAKRWHFTYKLLVFFYSIKIWVTIRTHIIWQGREPGSELFRGRRVIFCHASAFNDHGKGNAGIYATTRLFYENNFMKETIWCYVFRISSCIEVTIWIYYIK